MDKSDTPRTKQIAAALESMRHADQREVEYAYRDAIISDVGDMERELSAANAALEEERKLHAQTSVRRQTEQTRAERAEAALAKAEKDARP